MNKSKPAVAVDEIENEPAEAEAVTRASFRTEAAEKPMASEADHPLMKHAFSGPKLMPRKALIYGVSGVGKTTFASKSNKPFFIQTEEGANTVGPTRLPLATSLKQFDEQVEMFINFAQRSNRFRTLVIDSVDWLGNLIHDEVATEHDVGDIREMPYAAGFNHAMPYWHNFLEQMDDVRSHGVHVVMLSHCIVTRFNNPEGEDFDRFQPKLHVKTILGTLTEWCDEVLFACFETHTKTEDVGFGRTKAKGLGRGRRILRTQERPFAMAKNRLNMPETISLDSWNNYSQYFGE